MNGSRTLEGFVPSRDATVVTRLLEAGATITGKSVCEDLCFSGGSHTSVTGPVRNPWDTNRTTGGSSSGSAALITAAMARPYQSLPHSPAPGWRRHPFPASSRGLGFGLLGAVGEAAREHPGHIGRHPEHPARTSLCGARRDHRLPFRAAGLACRRWPALPVPRAPSGRRPVHTRWAGRG
ncbi:MAG: amidase family protein [Streptosporangiaceae bacterium]